MPHIPQSIHTNIISFHILNFLVFPEYKFLFVYAADKNDKTVLLVTIMSTFYKNN